MKSYRYSGLEASLYDQLDELSDFEDIEFYLWFVEAVSGPVLDIGCGTGRVMLPMLERGMEVVGLDYSSEMLALCRSKLESSGLEARLVKAEMQDFDLGKLRFGSVLIPGFSLQMLLEDESIDRCLECCFKHLEPEGQLILPTYIPWDMIWDGREHCPMEEKVKVKSGESRELLSASQGWDICKREQRLVLKNRYDRRTLTGELIESEEKEMTLKWHLPHDMLERLSRIGFGDVSIYGDFSFEPPDEDSESIIYIARK